MKDFSEIKEILKLKSKQYLDICMTYGIQPNLFRVTLDSVESFYGWFFATKDSIKKKEFQFNYEPALQSLCGYKLFADILREIGFKVNWTLKGAFYISWD